MFVYEDCSLATTESYTSPQILETALQDGLTEDAGDVYEAIRGSGSGDVTEKVREINDSVKRYQVISLMKEHVCSNWSLLSRAKSSGLDGTVRI